MNGVTKKNNSQSGMFTVEAVFVVPIMIFSILGIIYLSVLLYQNTVAAAEATRSANRIASYWSYIDVASPPALQNGMEASALIDEKSYTRRSPYRFISETLALLGGMRMNNGTQYAKTRIAGIPFERYTDGNPADVTVNARMGFLCSYIEVTFTKRYINPLGKLLEQIGIAERQEYTATATALVTNPTEFIRNFDILYDIGETVLGKMGGN